MLPAHAVPGYFIAVRSQRHWDPQWGKAQRALLWVLAVGSTIAPDADVLYNALFRGFFGHSTLWTHSLFPYLPLCLCWWLLGCFQRWSYLRAAIGLTTPGSDPSGADRPELHLRNLNMVMTQVARMPGRVRNPV